MKVMVGLCLEGNVMSDTNHFSSNIDNFKCIKKEFSKIFSSDVTTQKRAA